MKALVFYMVLFLFSIQIAAAQNLNTVIKDPDLNKDVMVGKCDRTGLKQGEYGLYFKSQYEVYQPSEKYIEKMKVKINLVDRELQPVINWNQAPGIRGFLAVQLGKVRLIDNIRFI